MKKCPFCAEAIQEQATVCLYCSRPQPQGLMTIHERGTNHALGTDTRGEFAVWDLRSGQWLRGWPATPKGWKAAWTWYSSMEQGQQTKVWAVLSDLPAPAPGRPPELLTFGAALAAAVATVMTWPAAATTFTPESAAPGWQGPSGWQEGLWTVAFVIGASSMALAIRAIRRERARETRIGKLLAWAAACMAWVGACIWVLPFLVQIGSGL